MNIQEIDPPATRITPPSMKRAYVDITCNEPSLTETAAFLKDSISNLLNSMRPFRLTEATPNLRIQFEPGVGNPKCEIEEVAISTRPILKMTLYADSIEFLDEKFSIYVSSIATYVQLLFDFYNGYLQTQGLSEDKLSFVQTFYEQALAIILDPQALDFTNIARVLDSFQDHTSKQVQIDQMMTNSLSELTVIYVQSIHNLVSIGYYLYLIDHLTTLEDPYTDDLLSQPVDFDKWIQDPVNGANYQISNYMLLRDVDNFLNISLSEKTLKPWIHRLAIKAVLFKTENEATEIKFDTISRILNQGRLIYRFNNFSPNLIANLYTNSFADIVNYL